MAGDGVIDGVGAHGNRAAVSDKRQAGGIPFDAVGVEYCRALPVRYGPADDRYSTAQPVYLDVSLQPGAVAGIGFESYHLRSAESGVESVEADAAAHIIQDRPRADFVKEEANELRLSAQADHSASSTGVVTSNRHPFGSNAVTRIRRGSLLAKGFHRQPDRESLRVRGYPALSEQYAAPHLGRRQPTARIWEQVDVQEPVHSGEAAVMIVVEQHVPSGHHQRRVVLPVPLHPS